MQLWPYCGFSNSTWNSIGLLFLRWIKRSMCFPIYLFHMCSDLIAAWITNSYGSSSNEFSDFLPYCVTLEMFLHLIVHSVSEVEYKNLISRTVDTRWMRTQYVVPQLVSGAQNFRPDGHWQDSYKYYNSVVFYMTPAEIHWLSSLSGSKSWCGSPY